MSGHGNFRDKLHSFEPVEDPACECGNPETAEHVLKECSKFPREGQELINRMGEKGLEEKFLLKKRNFEAIRNFAASVIKAKEEEEYSKARERDQEIEPRT